MDITDDDVQHVAELAHLELTEKERAGMRHDLASILGYIAKLNELDTSSVPPMSQIAELLGEENGAGAPALREDKPIASLDRAEVLAAAPETDGTFFKVPKVIDR